MGRRWRSLREMLSRQPRAPHTPAVLSDEDAAIQRGLQALGVKSQAQLARETWEREYGEWYRQWHAQQTHVQLQEWDRAYARWRGEYMQGVARQQHGLPQPPPQAGQAPRAAPPPRGAPYAPQPHLSSSAPPAGGPQQQRDVPHFTPLEKVLIGAAVLMILATLVDAGLI
eukprot:TRINITY_DN3973_c0_g4_i1.p1 TRINITY_DN3973_c0_g4~~TRINITY_DN3973_c0_g4_i1.p1  ORF type:complete len:170 (+),score=45.24 TRINITY_DN3973_c0_g4_i1:52-561(+)